MIKNLLSALLLCPLVGNAMQQSQPIVLDSAQLSQQLVTAARASDPYNVKRIIRFAERQKTPITISKTQYNDIKKHLCCSGENARCFALLTALTTSSCTAAATGWGAFGAILAAVATGTISGSCGIATAGIASGLTGATCCYASFCSLAWCFFQCKELRESTQPLKAIVAVAPHTQTMQ